VKYFLALFFFASCSSSLLRDRPQEGKNIFAYFDESGDFRFSRETKKINSKIITRTQILDKKMGQLKPLEKSVMVSRIGSIKNKHGRLLTLRPEASDFIIWLDGKKYISRMRINSSTKSLKINLESPDPKWQGTMDVPFPKGNYFCFYNQLPECLYHTHLLKSALTHDKDFEFYVIWDSYPYVQDLFSKVGSKLFAAASVKFDGEINGLFRYIVEVEGQTILYQFTKSFELIKMAWISQGITVAPPGEEIIDDENL
jgi:hypothetical protein